MVFSCLRCESNKAIDKDKHGFEGNPEWPKQAVSRGKKSISKRWDVMYMKVARAMKLCFHF